MSRSLFARLARRYGPQRSGITRRELLRASAAAGAGLLLSRAPTFTWAQTVKPNGRRVVVIGGGFSGLSCAHELKSAGYDVTVIEARNRVGGRVLSFGDLVTGKNVEGGGELIGSNHPTWVAYADKFGLKFLDVTEDESLEMPILLGGKKLTSDDAETLYVEIDEALGSMNADAGPIHEDEPWTSPNAAELDKTSVGDWLQAQTISDLSRAGLAVMFTADNAVAPDLQSYLGLLAAVKGGGLEKYWTDSEIYRCEGGNQQLAFKLTEAIGKDRVVTKLAVTDVEVKEKNAIVKCADGRTLECDEVVLAAPPSVWGKIRFSPELPAALKPQMGVAVKYLAGVKKRFWKSAGLAPDSLADGDLCMTWEGTDNQPGDDGAALVGFSGGPPAARCLEYPKEQRDAKYTTLIESLYPGYKDNFTATRFMDWPKDPWTMAGYSFPAPGQVTTQGKLLHEGRGRLHFAGEHCCYKFVGYMEGGLNSGASLARRIAKRDGVS